MMEHQPYEQPVPFAAYAGARAPAIVRPTSVTVIAILAIVFGSFGVLVYLCSIPGLLLSRAGLMPGAGMSYNTTVSNTTTTNGVTTTTNVHSVSPQSFAYMREPTYIIYSVANALIFLLLWIAAIWAGIGLLKMYPGARTWIIRYAIADLVFGSVRFIFYVLLIQPKILASMQTMMSQAGGSNPMPNMAPMMNAFMYVGDVFSLLLLSWPIAVLFVMSRPHVKAAFGIPLTAQ